MKNLILFDNSYRDNLKPFTFTRPIAEIRVGITTIYEKWASISQLQPSYQTVDYLQEKFPLQLAAYNLFVDASYIPTNTLWQQIKTLPLHHALMDGENVIAFYTSKQDVLVENAPKVAYTGQPLIKIGQVWDIFSHNAAVLEMDFDRITQGRQSQPLSPTNQLVGDSSRLFIEEGAEVECSILNTKNGSIYIGKNAVVMEGSIVRGALALCDHAQLKLGAKIYGATTIGPHSKMGGEINNSVIFGHSNKGHEGFLGNAVLGEWCNLGAGTNNSNLKNNYGEIKVWNYNANRFINSGLQFCGLIMGDHSKAGIDTMFNTGTVVGVSSNVYGGGFPRKFIPSFSWGGSAGFMTYKLAKVYETATLVMQRRGKVLDEVEKAILEKVFEMTATQRRWEKK